MGNWRSPGFLGFIFAGSSSGGQTRYGGRYFGPSSPLFLTGLFMILAGAFTLRMAYSDARARLLLRHLESDSDGQQSSTASNRSTQGLKILKVACSECGTLDLIPYSAIGNEPIKCEKCGKVLVVKK